MKILFVTPSRYLSDGRLFKLNKLYIPSMTFPLLAALAPDDFEITVVNEELDEIDFDKEFDIIGITTYSINVFRAYEIADKFRARDQFVIMGGIHVSSEPDEALKHSDSVFIGEAENTWPKFLQDFKKGRPEKVYKSDCLSSLADLPVPKYSILEKSSHAGFNRKGFKRLMKPVYSIQTGRGCPYSCDFCTVTKFYGSRYRSRPISDIVREIKDLNAEVCFFIDENIFADSTRSKKFLKELIPLEINWIAQSTIHSAEDEELISLAEKSGCIGLLIGLESISEANLKSVGKSRINPVRNYEKYIKIFQKYNILLDISMMFGFENDDTSTFKDAYNFIVKNKIPFIIWWPITPLPGTSLYTRLRDSGKLKDNYWWLNPDLNKLIYDLKFYPENISETEFKNGFFKYYLKFYSLRNIMKRFLFPPRKGFVYCLLYSFFIRKSLKNQIVR